MGSFQLIMTTITVGRAAPPEPATVVILTGGHYEQLGDIFEGGDSFYPRHCSGHCCEAYQTISIDDNTLVICYASQTITSTAFRRNPVDLED